MTPVPDPKTLKKLGLISYVAFLATVLLTATSYNENSFITDVSTLQLALCSAASLTIPLAIFRRRKLIGRRECLTWIVLAVGCAVLAMDDKLMLHERLDQTIHAVFGWEETRISDKIDDIIVGLYGVIGIVFIAANRRFFLFSARFMAFTKGSIASAFIMVLCDMRSLYGLNETQNQVLTHLEEWSKIFGGALLLIGLLCALEDAMKTQARIPEDLHRQP